MKRIDLDLGTPGNGTTGGADGRSRKGVGRLILVATASVAVGAAATYVLVGPRPATHPEQVAAPTAAPDEGAGHGGMAGMEGAPAGERQEEAGAQRVYISPARQQMIGVRTATVGHQQLDTSIRTVGALAFDETKVAQVHTKIAGWVERVFVDYIGKTVRRDEPLFTVYSPELVSTQTEYLLALKARAEMGTSAVPATRAAAASLLAAARARLELWDIPEEHIAELERSGTVQKTLMLHSPFDGVVLERDAFPGQYITPEMTAFKIADLSRIWALGSVFEYELPLLALGQDAEIEFPYGQSKTTLQGRITFISPEIDPQSRRVKVRAEFANPGQRLKPETFVTMTIRTGGGHLLAIPKEALIDNGVKRYALLALPDGYFEPREIQTGPPSDEYFAVLSGLQEGDRIVTSAQFLIDSETNLQAAMQAMAGMAGMEAPGGPEKPPPARPAAKAAPAGGSMEGMEMPSPTPPPDHQQH